MKGLVLNIMILWATIGNLNAFEADNRKVEISQISSICQQAIPREEGLDSQKAISREIYFEIQCLKTAVAKEVSPETLTQVGKTCRDNAFNGVLLEWDQLGWVRQKMVIDLVRRYNKPKEAFPEVQTRQIDPTERAVYTWICIKDEIAPNESNEETQLTLNGDLTGVLENAAMFTAVDWEGLESPDLDDIFLVTPFRRIEIELTKNFSLNEMSETRGYGLYADPGKYSQGKRFEINYSASFIRNNYIEINLIDEQTGEELWWTIAGINIDENSSSWHYQPIRAVKKILEKFGIQFKIIKMTI